VTESDDDDLTPEFLKGLPEPTWRTHVLTFVCLCALVGMIYAVCYMLAGFGQELRKSFPLPVVVVKEDEKSAKDKKQAQKKQPVKKESEKKPASKPQATKTAEAKQETAKSSASPSAKPAEPKQKQTGETDKSTDKPASDAKASDQSKTSLFDAERDGVFS